MAPTITTVLASLALLTATAVAVPGGPSSYRPKFPSATISLYDKLFCASDSLLVGTPYVLNPGSCQNNPSNETFISANVCLEGDVPKGYECKVILYSDAGCAGAGTATAPLVKDQEMCYLKLTASEIAQRELGGASVGLVCPALADGTTIA